MIKKKSVLIGIILVVILALIISVVIIALYPQVSTLPSDYRNAPTLINDATNWESRYPSLISHSQIGTTVNGTPIYVFKIGNPDGGKVLIDASIHGNENAGSEVVWWFMNWLLTSQDQDAVNIKQRNYVMVVPILNIDEFQVERENAHEVDLNRNYKVGWGTFNDTERGSAPLSEPETQAMYNFVSGLHLSLSSKTWYLNVHTGETARISPPWSYQNFTPEKSYYEAVYSNYSRMCNSIGSIPLPYAEQNNFGGGLARDQMYALGAYSFTVEVTNTLLPPYSTVSSNILSRFKPLVITLCQESEINSGSSTTKTTIPKDWKDFVLNYEIEISDVYSFGCSNSCSCSVKIEKVKEAKILARALSIGMKSIRIRNGNCQTCDDNRSKQFPSHLTHQFLHLTPLPLLRALSVPLH